MKTTKAPSGGSTTALPTVPRFSFVHLLARTLVLCFTAFAVLSTAQAADVSTDQLDYFPGDTVQITGSGFNPGEIVVCEVEHLDGLDTGNGHDPWYVTADENGSFTTTWYVDPDDSAWATFILTAIGQDSGLVATAIFTDAPSKADIDQAQIGPADSPLNPVNWVNGNLNSNNSHYVEGYSVPYRLVMTDLPTDGSTVTVTLEYDAKHSGAHAIDWITHYECLDNPDHMALYGHAHETIDPTLGVTGIAPVTTTLTIPVPPFLNAPVDTPVDPVDAFNDSTTPDCPKEVTLFGGTLTPGSFVYGPPADLSQNNISQQFTLSFVPTSATAVLAWGGHIARVLDWGYEADGITPRSAGGISGSPYHMRTIDWNLNNLGNQDLQLSADAVTAPPTCDLPEDFNSCPNTVNTHTVTATNADTYSWSFTSNTSGAFFVGPTDGVSVDVNSGNSNGSYTVQVTVSNDGGETTCMQTVTINDLEPPQVSCPIDLVLECGDPIPDPGDPTVSDNCDPAPSVIYNEQTTGSCPTVITRTWTVTDDVGNESECSQTITINDTLPPVLPTLPSGGDLGCTLTPPSCVTGLVATDICDGDVPVICTPGAVTGDECGYIQTFTYTATDTCGNSASDTVTYTWKTDVTPPVLTGCPSATLDVQCNGDIPPAPTVTANDNCDGVLTVNFVQNPTDTSGVACGGTVTRTWTATDACGNVASCSQTITVDDTIPPVLPQLPSGGDLGCTTTRPTCTDGLTATDNCDGSIPVICTPGPLVGDECGYTQVFTYSATDTCGNVSSDTVTYSWKEDTTPPVLPTLPGGGDLGCTTTRPTCTDGLTATDNCDGSIPVICTPGPLVGDECGYTQVFTYSATDLCGNVSSDTVTYTWKEDTTPPVLTGCPPATLDVQCNGDIPLPPTVTANDNCDGPLTVFFVQDPVDASGVTCGGTVTRTWTATDACGNVASCTQTITVDDTIPPVLPQLPPGGNLGCTTTRPVCATGLTATDNCDGSIPVICTPGPLVGDECGYTQVFTYSATDTCGNVSSDTVTYTWKEDTTPPVLSGCPSATLDVQCNGDIPTPANVTALDNCDGPLTVVLVQDPVDASGVACGGTVTRTWTATDSCGNQSSCSQVITVDDTIPPVLPQLPPGGNLGCTTTRPVCATGLTATDNCDGSIPVICTPGPLVGDECGYTQVFTYSATDRCGNVSSDTVTYSWKEDTTPPVLTGCPPATLDVQCNGDIPLPPTVTANDNCDGPLTVFFVQDPVDASGVACGGTVTRTWTATDACGNVARCVQVITVDDTIPPVLPELPQGSNLGCTTTRPTCATGLIATDNCDGSIPVICTPGQIVGDECGYTQVFTYSATDTCGNVSSDTVTYTWKEDVTPPVLSGCPPARLNLQCNGDIPLPPTVTALDNCDGPLTVIYVQDPVDASGVACGGTVTRTWTATDSCGNQSSCSQVITVDDTTPPVLPQLPPGGDLGCTTTRPVCATGLTAADNCDGSIPVICTPGPLVGDECGYTQVFTYSATDACGNVSSDTVTYTWKEDTTPPVLTGCPADATVECRDDIPDPATVTANDNCDGTRNVVFQQTPEDISTVDPCGGTITRTWTTADECGNQASCTQVITLHDTTNPEITKLGMEHELFVVVTGDPDNPQDGDTIRVLLLNLCGLDPLNWEDPEATDNCAVEDLDWVDSGPVLEPTETGFANLYTRVITVEDACNQVQVTVEVLVPECPTHYCTLTQGGWSVPDKFADKLAPAKTNGISRDIIVMKLFNDPACGGPRSLWIGKAGGNYVEVLPTEWKALRLLLPGGGKAGPLPNPTMIDGIVAESSELTPLLKKNGGSFNNVLIGQYVAMQLNVWLGDCPEAAADADHPVMDMDNLGELVMTTGFCTLPADKIPLLQKQLAIDPESVPCYLEELGAYHGTVPQGVFDALDNLGMGHTVNDLLELTRLYLAGLPAGGVKAGDLNTALSSFNEGFDECRTLLDPAFCECAEAP